MRISLRDVLIFFILPCICLASIPLIYSSVVDRNLENNAKDSLVRLFNDHEVVSLIHFEKNNSLLFEKRKNADLKVKQSYSKWLKTNPQNKSSSLVSNQTALKESASEASKNNSAKNESPSKQNSNLNVRLNQPTQEKASVTISQPGGLAGEKNIVYLESSSDGSSAASKTVVVMKPSSGIKTPVKSKVAASADERLEEFKEMERLKREKEERLKEIQKGWSFNKDGVIAYLSQWLSSFQTKCTDEIVFRIKKFDYLSSQNHPKIYAVVYPWVDRMINYFMFEADSKLIILLKILGCLILYALYCLPLMSLAQEFETGKYYLAWIPIGQELLIFKMAKKDWKYFMWYIFPIINLMAIIRIWWRIASFKHKAPIFSLLMIVPGLNILALWYFSR